MNRGFAALGVGGVEQRRAVEVGKVVGLLSGLFPCDGLELAWDLMKRGFAALGGGGARVINRWTVFVLWFEIQSLRDSITGGDLWEKRFYSGKRPEAF
jgi:hypothetical protein